MEMTEESHDGSKYGIPGLIIIVELLRWVRSTDTGQVFPGQNGNVIFA